MVNQIFYCHSGNTCTQSCSRNNAGNEVCTVRGCCSEHPFCAPNRSGCYYKGKDGEQIFAQKLAQVIRDIANDEW